jgi:hypothetical protein
MTIATWILAIATVALAIEGGTALFQWMSRLRIGRTRREIEAIRQEIKILHHAAWIAAAPAGQGSITDVEEKMRTMLSLDGWQPDMELMAEAGYYSLSRLQGDAPEGAW